MPVPPGSDDHLETMRLVARRAHDTQQTTQTTLDRVGALRYELGQRIDQLDSQVGELAVSSARVEGKLDILVGSVSRSLDAQSQVHISAVTARIEMEKTGQRALIDERKERMKLIRDVIIKVIAGVGVVWATIATVLAKGC